MKTLARTQDVPPGTIRAFDPAAETPKALSKNALPILRAAGIGRPSGTRVLLANVDGKFYAIDNTCTHLGCSLSDGRLDGSVVQCACHGSRFEVTTGAVVGGPAQKPVRSYPVQVVGDEVKVDV
jgi:3-phenylpropionate/trans-cinnamate dioxygenase ferredoxin component